MTFRASRVLLATVIFLCGAAPFLSAQDAATDWFVGKPIKQFTFTGLITVKEADLQAILKPYVGQASQRRRQLPILLDLQTKLYALDDFETIIPNAVPGDDAKTVLIIKFEVKEKPSVVAIVVTGNATVRTAEITDKILVKKGDLANQTRLQADVAAVKSLYLEKGYTDVTVSASFVPGGHGYHREGGFHGRGRRAHHHQGDPVLGQHLCVGEHAARADEDEGPVPL